MNSYLITDEEDKQMFLIIFISPRHGIIVHDENTKKYKKWDSANNCLVSFTLTKTFANTGNPKITEDILYADLKNVIEYLKNDFGNDDRKIEVRVYLNITDWNITDLNITDLDWIIDDKDNGDLKDYSDRATIINKNALHNEVGKVADLLKEKQGLQYGCVIRITL